MKNSITIDMQAQKIIKKRKLPDSPGVYLFTGARGKILYVGKATSLKSRVRSYFGKDIESTRGPLIVKMLAEATGVKWEGTDSVLEALILEANLIKKHQPPYNSREKDNKSFNYLAITDESPPAGGFPRVLVIRGRELFGLKTKNLKLKTVFGPFPQGGALKTALKIIRKIFPFRDSCAPPTWTKRGFVHNQKSASKPCFNRQLGLCPGVCSGEVTKAEYAKTIRNIKLLFEGKKGALIRKIEGEMKKAAKAEQFENAAEMRNQIFALRHINDAALIGDDFRIAQGGDTRVRIEAYDVAHMQEDARVGVMVVVEEGEPQKAAYRKFKIQTAQKGDVAALHEVLVRRFAHAPPEGGWPLPRIIVVDGSIAQMRAARAALKEYGYEIPVVGVVKNEKHRAARIIGVPKGAYTNGGAFEQDVLLANSEAHRFAVQFHRKRLTKRM
ncbi:MAG: UvrB/UvrC motif-containing protein [bacterium]|nr:UvrB/UvrC motif-containing protein [bacterium]